MSDLEKRVRVQLRKTGKKSLAADELSRRAGVGKSEKKEFGVLLSKMAEQGELVRQQNHKVVLARCVGAKPATIIKVKKTFGFARIDDAQQDVFVPGRQLMGTLPGDRVMVRVSRSEGELDAGEVLSVIERAKIVFPALWSEANTVSWNLSRTIPPSFRSISKDRRPPPRRGKKW